MVLLHVAVGTASANSDEIKPRVGYIPTPSAKSAGRPAVIARLRQLGKEEFKNAQRSVAEGCPDFVFEAKILLDTPALFSLEMNSYWTCDSRATQDSTTPLLFEMNSGREYEVSRLYHVRDAHGALVAPLRRLLASRLDPKQLGMTSQDVAKMVSEDLSRGRPHLFTTKTGIWVLPEASHGWMDEEEFTWADLLPYLDVVEAKRIGWPEH